MGVISKTVTHGIVLDTAPVGPPADPVCVQDDDMHMVVGRVPVTVVQEMARENDVEAGALVSHGQRARTVMALPGLISTRDIESFGGYLRTTDRKFRTARVDWSDWLPKAGDKLSTGGKDYEVIGVDEATLRNAVSIYARG